MKEKTAKTDVGIIIARMQAHEITEGHKALIDSVLDRHEKVIIFLGLSPLRNTLRNPLDFRSRQKMLNDVYPNIEVYYVDDCPSDELWSSKLDAQISKWTKPGYTATLYGSRDSFISHYCGKNPTCELESEVFISASQVRRQISLSYPHTKDFRAGMIAATANRYPVSYQTVDVAVINDKNEVLLVMKPNETKWRFPGGFADPRSNSLEEDARREVTEETGVEIEEIQYVGSTIIDDWRYRSEKDKIKTALFKARYVFGRPEGQDDVAKATWFSLDKLKEEDMVREHHVLLTMLKNNL